MTETVLPLAMTAVLLAGIAAGYRVAFVLGGTAALFILVSDLPYAFFGLIVTRIYANVLSNWLLVAIPMFIFMGLVLERSGVAERSLRAIQTALGGSAAGMGIAVLVIGVTLAAASGIVGAAVVLLTLLALPRLVEAGFPKTTASGLVAASGTMAILMPPSVMLIILGDQLSVPIPSMFSGAIVPTMLLTVLYAAFVIYKARNIHAAPNSGARTDFLGIIGLFKDTAPLVLLVLCVLGSIVGGLATPTEASGLGALGAIIITILYGKFSADTVFSAARETVSATSMVMLVIVGATCFSAVFRGIGGDDAISNGLFALSDSPWQILAVIMLTIFILGMVLDWLEITLVLMPIFGPLVAGLDFGNGLDPQQVLLWFGILVAVNLQTSFLTPPFGFSLFYLRGAASISLSTRTIYQGVIPFIILQALALGILIAFPKLITWYV